MNRITKYGFPIQEHKYETQPFPVQKDHAVAVQQVEEFKKGGKVKAKAKVQVKPKNQYQVQSKKGNSQSQGQTVVVNINKPTRKAPQQQKTAFAGFSQAPRQFNPPMNTYLQYTAPQPTAQISGQQTLVPTQPIQLNPAFSNQQTMLLKNADYLRIQSELEDKYEQVRRVLLADQPQNIEQKYDSIPPTPPFYEPDTPPQFSRDSIPPTPPIPREAYIPSSKLPRFQIQEPDVIVGARPYVPYIYDIVKEKKGLYVVKKDGEIESRFRTKKQADAFVKTMKGL